MSRPKGRDPKVGTQRSGPKGRDPKVGTQRSGPKGHIDTIDINYMSYTLTTRADPKVGTLYKGYIDTININYMNQR
jgi:hypothetical protein